MKKNGHNTFIYYNYSLLQVIAMFSKPSSQSFHGRRYKKDNCNVVYERGTIVIKFKGSKHAFHYELDSSFSIKRLSEVVCYGIGNPRLSDLSCFSRCMCPAPKKITDFDYSVQLMVAEKLSSLAREKAVAGPGGFSSTGIPRAGAGGDYVPQGHSAAPRHGAGGHSSRMRCFYTSKGYPRNVKAAFGVLITLINGAYYILLGKETAGRLRGEVQLRRWKTRGQG